MKSKTIRNLIEKILKVAKKDKFAVIFVKITVMNKKFKIVSKK